MLRVSLARQLGHEPLSCTGQAGSGVGAGQWPSVPQLGQNHRAVWQQGHTAVLTECMGDWCGLAPGWGAGAGP
jgi:hypothetical protein